MVGLGGLDISPAVGAERMDVIWELCRPLSDWLAALMRWQSQSSPFQPWCRLKLSQAGLIGWECFLEPRRDPPVVEKAWKMFRF